MTEKQERQQGILDILARNRKAKVRELAEHFQVSRRTILRDIDDLSYAHYPIYTDAGNGGGIFVMEGEEIFRSVMKAEDETFLSSLIPRLQPDEREKMETILKRYSSKKHL